MKRVIFLSVIILSLITVRSTAQITDALISGSLTVGSVLTAGTSGTPAPGNFVLYEWFWSDNTSLGTSPTYTIDASDQGKMFYVIASEYKPVDTLKAGPFTSSTTAAVNYMPVSTTPVVTGTPNPGQILEGSYSYSDAEGNPQSSTTLQWYRSSTGNQGDAVPVPGANSKLYLVTSDDYNKYLAFAVTPRSSAGSLNGLLTFSAFTTRVNNMAPLATSVTITGPGTFNVNDVLVGDYTYSDAEGDQEGTSVYAWIRSVNNTISADDVILPVTTLYYKLSLPDTGKYIFFRVTPRAVKGNITGAPVSSSVSGRVNTPPYVKNVGISGSVIIGQTITGTYTFGDRDGDDENPGGSIYRWYRGANLITGEITRNYLVSEDDEGLKITFEVTPVSSPGFPANGLTQSYQYPTAVPVSPNLPVADQLCIDGINEAGNILTGKYHYYNTSNDNKFKFRWMRDGDTIPGIDTKTYMLSAQDNYRNIRFVVYPVSKSGLRKGITAVSDTLARINLLTDDFFETEPDQIITGIPAGGNFYGSGIKVDSVTWFSPSSLGSGNFTINYQIIDQQLNHTCQQTDPMEISITPVSTYFEGVNSRYCTNDKKDTIYARNILLGAFNYRFRMTVSDAIDSSSADMVIIDPEKLKPGINTTELLYKCDVLKLVFDINTFFFKIEIDSIIAFQKSLVVNEAPSLTMNILEDKKVFCSNEREFKLTPKPAGGVLSGGPVTSTGFFNPDEAGARYDTVTYTYTNPSTGCTSSMNYPVVINPAPDAEFELADTCIAGPDDPTVFINKTYKTATNDIVKKWEWRFLESGGEIVKNDSSASYLYRTGGIHNVELIATTVNNCPDTVRHSLDLGNKPVADFYWLNECFHQGGSDKLQLHDLTESESIVNSITWIFPNNNIITRNGPIIDTTFTYPKADSGYIDIQYIVRTNYHNCHDTVTKKIYIRPTVTIPADGYFQNFESGKKGWVPYNLNDSIWSFGKPTGRTVINKAASGVNAWYTSYTIGKQKPGDTASIVSPCFDFKGVERPMIRMMLWKQFDKDRDGAVLQYKIGDEPGWKPVGTLDEGINWFNSALIGGKPGGSNLGWTSGPGNSKDPYYVESSNKLDSLSDEIDVKFRIAYGSDGSSKNNDGMAFDSIWIGRRTRGVLVEHFTNNSSAATDQVSGLANRWTDDVINIQYHTNFPASDPFYNMNPADASARLVFYGLTKTPYTFIDGGTDNPNFASLFDYNQFPFDSSKISKRSLIKPVFRIDMKDTINSGHLLEVSGNVRALRDISAENLTLYIAVTQKKGISSGDSKMYYNIFRKLIPDAGGIPMQKVMKLNEDFSIPKQTWNYSGFDNSDMEVIVFIQNNITKIVYQAESVIHPNIVVGIDNLAQPGKTEFSIWPNPSSGKLIIEFDQPLNSETYIKICDFSGNIVRTYKTSTGDSQYVIEDHGLKNGIYLVRISSGGIDKGFRKLVVSNNR